MKQIKTMACIVFVLLSFGGLHAQESLNSSGSVATGTGGVASYSVGQVFYTTISGSNGSLAQGVQQPYEISEVIGIDEITFQMEMIVFPNPTTNHLTLTTGDNSPYSYQLYDLQGRIIEEKEVSATNAYIDMEALPTATYFLKVSKNSRTIKTFKIIKN